MANLIPPECTVNTRDEAIERDGRAVAVAPLMQQLRDQVMAVVDQMALPVGEPSAVPRVYLYCAMKAWGEIHGDHNVPAWLRFIADVVEETQVSRPN
jgi:hypothetical protein